MNRQRLLVVVVIAVAVLGAGVWLLWPTAKDPATSAATAGPYLVRIVGDPPKVGVGALTVEVSATANRRRSR